jgi:hypothetical protein
MGAFDALTLAWAGSEYVIPGKRVTGAIAPIEDLVTLDAPHVRFQGYCGRVG